MPARNPAGASKRTRGIAVISTPAFSIASNLFDAIIQCKRLAVESPSSLMFIKHATDNSAIWRAQKARASCSLYRSGQFEHEPAARLSPKDDKTILA